MERESQSTPLRASSDRARIAVIGAGSMGRRHVAGVRASRHARLAALVDPDPSARDVAAADDAPWFRTVEDLLNAGVPDGAIIATPNRFHHAHAASLIAQGVPVLIEKPVATSVAEGNAIDQLSALHQVPVLVGHHRRHSPRLLAACEVIRRGRLGQIVAVSATTLLAKPPEYFDAAPWRREAGGGPILINLIHDVDVLRMLCGDVLEVQALASSAIRGRPVEETVAVALRFLNGAVGTMLLSDAAASPMGWEQTSGEDAAYPRYAGRDSYVVAGTRGTMTLPTMRLSTASAIPSWHQRMRESVIRATPADPLVRQLEHFVSVIHRSAEPMVTIHDGLESLRVTLAIAEAVSDRRAIQCAPPDGVP